MQQYVQCLSNMQHFHDFGFNIQIQLYNVQPGTILSVYCLKFLLQARQVLTIYVHNDDNVRLLWEGIYMHDKNEDMRQLLDKSVSKPENDVSF